jgi:hypothetical protein
MGRNRETYNYKIACKKCETEGSVTFEENENPIFSKGKLNRTLEDLSGPFIAVDGPNADVGPEIVCKTCSTPASKISASRN